MNSTIKGTSNSTKPHKFFERFLDNDLKDLTKFLEYKYRQIEQGQIIKGPLNTNEHHAKASSGSLTSMNWYQYNAFQFNHPSVHNIVKAVSEMTKEACEYYELDFAKEQFVVQGWFNINHAEKGGMDWHDHGGDGAPYFHGYYCVNAEPSITHYEIFGKSFDNINKNNRAILSETGHPHAMSKWDWQGSRITLAYDVFPLKKIDPLWEQHWFPLV